MAASSSNATTVEVKDSVLEFELKLPARLWVSDVQYATNWFSNEISRAVGVTFRFGWDAGWQCRCGCDAEDMFDVYACDCRYSGCDDRCWLARNMHVDAAYADATSKKKAIKISSMKLVVPYGLTGDTIHLYDSKKRGTVPSKWITSRDLYKRTFVRLAKGEESITLRLIIDLVLPPQMY